MEMKNRKKINKKRVFLSIVCGVSAGIANGIFGGGGGMIIVPMLTFLLGYKEKNSHATAILIILPLSILSCLLYSSFAPLSLNLFLPVLIGVTLGGVAGDYLLAGLSSKWIVIIFSIVMLGAGVKLLVF